MEYEIKYSEMNTTSKVFFTLKQRSIHTSCFIYESVSYSRPGKFGVNLVDFLLCCLPALIPPLKAS